MAKCRNLSVTADAVPLTGLRFPASASLSLASCWPQPQQRLPVSATGGGRRRCLPRGGLGIPESLISSPEAPLLGELAAKQTERLDEGQPNREAFAGLNLSVTADAVPPPLSRGGLGIPESLASSPEAPLLGELAAKQTERLDEGQPDRGSLWLAVIEKQETFYACAQPAL